MEHKDMTNDVKVAKKSSWKSIGNIMHKHNNTIAVIIYFCFVVLIILMLFQCFNYGGDIGIIEVEPFAAETLLAVCGVQGRFY